VSSGSLYVDGRWADASGPVLDVINPADESVIASLPSATEQEVEAALAAGRRAQPEWSRTPAPERGRHLRAMADLLEEERDSLAALLTAEVGKPTAQAQAELEFAIELTRYSAEWDRRLEGEILPGDVRGEAIHLLRAPLGVVAAICPWNFPLAVLCRKLVPALLTGNAVVAKPSEVAPLAALEFTRLVHDRLDLPPGVFNVVTGAGETGAALVRSKQTDMVSFTGHRDTGKGIMATAAQNLTRVALELGGKAPAIVWADADLDLTIPAIVEARHANSGQVCTCAERVLVHRSLADEFTERYVAAVRAIRVGDPTTAGSEMGPMVSAAQLDKSLAAVATAVEEGASVLAGGGRMAGGSFARGYWHEPTVLTGVEPSHRVMTEETFGPVTPIVAVDSLDEAVGIANDSRYGLSAYLFSRDYQTVMRTVEELQFGEIYINRTLGESVQAHHTGYKESGIGGEDGRWGLLRYTQIKTAYHHHG